MRILFIRHGEPDYENDTLTETGFKQAQLAAQRLKDEGIEEIWSSTQGRAVNAAKFTADLLGLPIKTTDFIREITWGSTNGEELFAGGHPWDIADEMARRGMELNDPDLRMKSQILCGSTLKLNTGTIMEGYPAIKTICQINHIHRNLSREA